MANQSHTKQKAAVKDTKEDVNTSDEISLFDLCDLILATGVKGQAIDSNVVQVVRQGEMIAVIMHKSAIGGKSGGNNEIQ